MQSFLKGMLFLQLQQTPRILKARFEAKKAPWKDAVLVTLVNLSARLKIQIQKQK